MTLDVPITAVQVAFLLGVGIGSAAVVGYQKITRAVWNVRIDLKNRASLAESRRHFAERRKAKIVKVGTVESNNGMTAKLEGWQFEPTPGVYPAMVGPDGDMAFHGYTVAELEEVYGRRGEFAP